MKLKEIMADHAFYVREAEEKVYHDEEGNATQEKIVFLDFDNEITYNGHSDDFAVMSRRVATKFKSCISDEEKISFLERCEFSRNDDGNSPQFAITMPKNNLFRFEPSKD